MSDSCGRMRYGAEFCLRGHRHDQLMCAICEYSASAGEGTDESHATEALLLLTANPWGKRLRREPARPRVFGVCSALWPASAFTMKQRRRSGPFPGRFDANAYAPEAAAAAEEEAPGDKAGAAVADCSTQTIWLIYHEVGVACLLPYILTYSTHTANHHHCNPVAGVICNGSRADHAAHFIRCPHSVLSILLENLENGSLITHLMRPCCCWRCCRGGL